MTQTAWTVRDYISIPKNPVAGNEDITVAGPDVFAVFDGVSSGVTPGVSVPRIDELTPGRYAALNGAAALETLATCYTDPRSLINAMSKALTESLHGKSDVGFPGYTFAAFIPCQNVVIVVGDCSVFFNGERVDRADKMQVDQMKADLRSLIIQQLLSFGINGDLIQQTDPTAPLMDFITRQWQPQFANSEDATFGYGVMNGTPVPDCHIEVISVPESVRSITLTTDGFPPQVVRNTTQETVQALESLLNKDPTCHKYWRAVRGIRPDGSNPDDATMMIIEKKC